MKKTAILAVSICFAFIAVFTPAFALDEGLPPDASLPRIPGMIQGTGTHFGLTDSAYLNITVDSTVPIDARLESVPRVVVLDVAASTAYASTVITLGGLAPDTLYYMYVDGPGNPAQITTDGLGCHAFTQDLTLSHEIVLQTQPSTVYLTEAGWSRPEVGDWDPVSRVATLKADLSETLQINVSDITLEGNGHSIVNPGAYYLYAYGIYAYASGVTIRNQTVQNFTRGIHFIGSWFRDSRTLVHDTTLIGNWFGLSLQSTYNVIMRNNRILGCQFGVNTVQSRLPNILNNEISDSIQMGIWLDHTSSANVTGNVISNTGSYGYGLL